MSRFHHVPVLLNTVLDILSPKPDESLLDVTLGLGGHTSAILERTHPFGVAVCLDADERNLRIAQENLKEHANRIQFIHANFSKLPDVLRSDHQPFNMILADLGLSSAHIDDAGRGFSFRTNAPLDMRFDASSGSTAADFISQQSADELIHIFRDYGEVPLPHKLAHALVAERKKSPVRTSGELVTVAEKVYGYKAKPILPLIFQGLRIAVNDELVSLKHLLKVAPSHLKPGGRLAIMSYHSLEDRMVKHAFRTLTMDQKDNITGAVSAKAPYAMLTKKPMIPSPEEIENNPRSRSAKLRAIIKF